MSDSIPFSQVILLRNKSKTLILAILESLDLNAELDIDLLEDVSHFFLRDIYRIDRQQKSSISASKFAGYWAFWIRKLKPISKPEAKTEAGEKYAGARSINELIALQFGMEMLLNCRRAEGFYDNVKRECPSVKAKNCSGVDCLSEYFYKYLNFDNEFYHEYLLYSMRNRTFGPHHFALLFENFTFSSCKGISNEQAN